MENLQTIIFTGLSGAGKTTALRAVEDLGFYCVDNLPLPLLTDFIELMKAEPAVRRTALVVDTRLGAYIEGYALASQALKLTGYSLEIVYLDARNDVLLRRFSQTRRRHPLGPENLNTGLNRERKLLSPLRAQASTCIDTSEFTVHELKALVQDQYGSEVQGMLVSILSFGFRHGLPSHVDVVFDVRFLPNPFFVDEMRELTGKEKTVSDYVLNADDSIEFVERTLSLLHFLLPRYEAEGKVYLTIAIGCTGGKHRSVAIAERIGSELGKERTVSIRHRDINR